MASNLNQYVIAKIIEYLNESKCKDCTGTESIRNIECKNCDFKKHVCNDYDHFSLHFNKCYDCHACLCKNCTYISLYKDIIEVPRCKRCNDL